MDHVDVFLNEGSGPGRFTEELVHLQVLEQEGEVARSLLVSRVLEAQRLIFHPRDPVRILGIFFTHNDGVEAVHLAVIGPATRVECIDVQAHEDVAVAPALGRPTQQTREHIGGAGHPDAHARILELPPEEHPHLQRDVLLLEPTRQEQSRVAVVGAAVPGIDHDDVTGTQSIGQPGSVASRPGRDFGQGDAAVVGGGSRWFPAGFHQPGILGVPGQSFTEKTRQRLGDELERDVQRVLHQGNPASHRPHPVVLHVKGRAHQQPQRVAVQRHLGPGSGELDASPQGQHER